MKELTIKQNQIIELLRESKTMMTILETIKGTIVTKYGLTGYVKTISLKEDKYES